MAGASFGSAQLSGQALRAHWRLGDGGRLMLLANLGNEPANSAVRLTGTPIWGVPEARLPPLSVLWSIEAP
jgi:maltooligosyltrehalose trehalohydrolase